MEFEIKHCGSHESNSYKIAIICIPLFFVLYHFSSFIQPILNGSKDKAKRAERKMMEEKVAILNTLLQSRISRKTVDLLENQLPRKTEFIIKLQLTTTQHQKYLQHLERVGFKDGIRGRSSGLQPQVITDSHVFSQICTYPSLDNRDHISTYDASGTDGSDTTHERLSRRQADNVQPVSARQR